MNPAGPYLDNLPKSSTPPTSIGGRTLPFWRSVAPIKKTLPHPSAQLALRARLFLKNFSSLRFRLVVVVFIAVAPALGLMFYTNLLWLGLLAGALAVSAAWVFGGALILRRINLLLDTTRHISAGDFSTRTHLNNEPGELGELARAIDSMTASLEKQIQERERVEKILFDRAHQQTVVAALGQFALVADNLSELLEQAVLLISQILEVEYCEVLELQPDGEHLLLRAGVGWKNGFIGGTLVDAHAASPVGYAFATGEPVIIADMQSETRFQPSPLHREHGVVSGINVVISGQPFPFGVLGVHTARRRDFTEDEIHLLMSVATVIAMTAERKRNESQLHKLAAFAQVNPNPVLEFSCDGALTYSNDAAARMTDSLNVQLKAILPTDSASIIKNCLATGRSKLRTETKLGTRTLSWSFFPVIAGNVVQCYVEDVTERIELEAQLRQSQKMESIGQLAAGVAHDFNNMLTVIQGHAGMILNKSGGNLQMFDSAQSICFAAERAANLTRQLLMFSRKNVMQPRLLDLRETVGTMTKMLRRLLGETISLEVSHPDELPAVNADPGMIEQVIMNLAVNARDAMVKGGTLDISTSLAHIGDANRHLHREGRPGSFVCLRVSDTGCGMDAVTLSRIFEPFFTTKEVGKGTGLGLATVYGIVKQHEGWIEVASEPGRGSAFTVFFPATDKQLSPAFAKKTGAELVQLPSGSETILVVEDEPVLRDMANMILQECGYKTLEASTGVEALSVWENHRNEIDLLLTDVVMPEGMTGKELADKLTRTKPGLKVVFTSGYSIEDINTAAPHFLPKPYNRFSLAKTVRACLDN